MAELTNRIMRGLVLALLTFAFLSLSTLPYVDCPIFKADAAYAYHFTVNVTVTDPFSNPVEDATVRRLYWNGSSWVVAATGTTNSSGYCDLSFDYAGSWLYSFVDLDIPGYYYNNYIPPGSYFVYSTTYNISLLAEYDLDAPVINSFTAPQAVNGNSMNIDWNASDPTGGPLNADGVGLYSYLLETKFESGSWVTELNTTDTGITSHTYNNATANGTYHFRLTVADNNGNLSTSEVFSVRDDQAPNAPALMPVVNNPNNNGIFDLGWTCADNGSAGISEYVVKRFTNGALSGTFSVYEPTRIHSETGLPQGIYTYEVYAIDSANNVGPSSYSEQVKVDTTPPDSSSTVTIAGNVYGSYTYTNEATVKLLLSASDNMTGISKMEFDNADNNWSPQYDYATEFDGWELRDPTTTGNKAVRARYTDGAGNTRDVINFYIRLDIDPPGGSITINDNSYGYMNTRSATLSITSSDTYELNALQMRFSNDGADWTDWESRISSKNWELTEGDGPKTVYMQVKDVAGNIAQYSDTTILDMTPPTNVTANINNDALCTTTVGVTVYYGAEDNLSGLRRVYLKNETGGTPPSGYTYYNLSQYPTSRSWNIQNTYGTREVYVAFVDYAGNYSTPVSDSIIYDWPLPVIDSFSINGGAHATNTTETLLNISARDDHSGVSSMEFHAWNEPFSGNWEPYSETRSWTIGGGRNCLKYVYIHVMDRAGRISSTTSDTIIYDTGTPESTVTTNGIFNDATWATAGGEIKGQFKDPRRPEDPDTDGISAVSAVDISIKRSSDGNFWNGTSGLWEPSRAWNPVTAPGTFNTGTKNTWKDWKYTIDSSNFDSSVTYTVDSRATDYAGNVQVIYGTNSFTFVNDQPLSHVLLDRSAYGESNWSTDPANPTIKGDAAAAPGADIASVRIQIQRMDNNRRWTGSSWVLWDNCWVDVSATLVSDGSGGYTWHYTGLPAGNLMNGKTYTIRCEATDNVTPTPNVQSPPHEDTFTFDNLIPSAALTSPVGGSTHKGEITFTGTASDEVGLDHWAIKYEDVEDLGTQTLMLQGSTIIENADFGNYNSEAMDDGTYNFYLEVEDWAGNVNAPGTGIVTNVTVDNNPPATTAQITSGTAGNGSWYLSNVEITLSAADTVSDSADIDTYYRINGADPDAYSPYVQPIVISLQGPTRIHFYSVDEAGNEESHKSIDINIDSADPESSMANISGTAGLAGWYVSDVDVTLTASDATSGLDQILYNLNGGGATAYTDTITLTENRQNQLECWATDMAGNVEDPHTYNIKIDKEQPTIIHTVAPANSYGWYTSPVTVTLAASDNVNGSGIVPSSYRYSVNGAPEQTGASVVLTADGTHIVEYWAFDVAGNESQHGTVSIPLDVTNPANPTITGPTSDNTFRTVSTMMNLSGTTPADPNNDHEEIIIEMRYEGGAPVQLSSVVFNKAGQTWYRNGIQLNQGDGDYEFTVWIRDKAGRLSPTPDTLLVTLDRIGPDITINAVESPTRFDTQVITGSWTDEFLTNVYLRVNGAGPVPAENINIGAKTWSHTVSLQAEYNTVVAWGVDDIGNPGGDETANIYLDQVPPRTPELNPVISPTNVTPQTISGTCDDADTDRVVVEVTFGPTITTFEATLLGGDTWQRQINFSDDGTYALNIYAVDEAGNRSLGTANADILYDTAEPENGTIVIDGGAEFTNNPERLVDLALNAPAGGGSSIVTMRLSNDNVNYYEFPYDTSFDGWLLTESEGLKTVYAIFVDGAGNPSDPSSTEITLDLTAPEIVDVQLNGKTMLEANPNPGIDNKVTNIEDLIIDVSATDNFTDFAGYPERIELEFINEDGALVKRTSGVNYVASTDPQPMEAGEYTIRITVIDRAENETVMEISGLRITGGDPEVVTDIIVAPNPFVPPLDGPDPNNTVKIWFTVTGDPTSNVAVYLHDTAGRLVWKEVHTVSNLYGRNKVEWTGYTHFNEIAENGVYLIRVVDEDNKKLIGKKKIIIIKRKPE